MILLYHRIARVDSDPWSLCVTLEYFTEHLDVLRRYSPVKLENIQSPQRLPARGDCSVVITFDDGYADNLYEAAPLLEHYGIPATFFIVTGYVGGNREFWWDELERIVFQRALWSAPIELTAAGRTHSFNMESESARKPLYFSLYDFLQPLIHEARLALIDQLLHHANQTAFVRPSHRVLTRDEVSKLARTSLFEIGAHTATHPKLSAQSIATQQAELHGSKTWLEELLGKPVNSFAYPYGGSHHYTAATAEAVRNAGFRYACTTAARYVKNTDAPLELPRFNITDMNGEELEKLLFY
jgi:peptidoglycan/xylan/chitin deacetylase (PgdA/CDA1 family)